MKLPSSLPLRRLVLAGATALALIGSALVASAGAPAVGLWRFNEGSGTIVNDSSGFNNNGTLTGENGNVPAWVTGQSGFGGALRFTNDGVNHAYVDIPGSSSLKIGLTATNTWTITAWAYEDSNGTGNFVANYGRIAVLDDGQALQYESGSSLDPQMYVWARANNAWQIPLGSGSPVAPLLDQWVHWALVYDGTNLTVYRNGNQGPKGGVLPTAVTAALGYSGYAGAVRIGTELGATADRNWNGKLDDVAVFAGTLSQAEIQTVMGGDFSAHVGGPAHILTQPQSQLVQRGDNVTFSVDVQGQPPITYRWYFNATNLLASTSNTLTLPNVQANQAGNYSVTVSNQLAVEPSQTAILIVNTNKVRLVGLWRFNEGSGTSTVDSSGFGNNGTLSGENGNVPAWVAGQTGFGGALRFTNDGANHAYVDIPGSSSLKIGLTATSTWTITAWAYEDSDSTGNFISTYGRIVVLDDGEAFQLESGALNDAQMYVWGRQTTAWQIPLGVGSPVAPLLDQWVHWAVVYDGTNLTVYRDGNQGPQGGVLPTAVTAALGYSGYSGSIHIGTELGQPANRTWNGLLDDVAIFNTALSAAEVNTIKSGNFTSFITRPPLFLNVSQGNVVLSWTAMLPGLQLQSSPSLSAPAWTKVATAPVQQGPVLTVTVASGPGTKFFRLVSP